MTKSEFLDMLDHDLAANIRNFQVVHQLLCGPDMDIDLGNTLLRASIEQLQELRKGLSKMALDENDNSVKNKPLNKE